LLQECILLSNDPSTRRFVREALPLLSSYLYSENVTLEPTEVETGAEYPDEYQEFANLLKMRHAVACGLRLKPILEAVERGTSHVSEIIRRESKGDISGRLDIPLYLSRRGMNMSWPRSFPVLIAADTPNTPENQLIAETLRQFGRRLNESQFHEASAERAYSLNLLRWTREQLHSEPWSRVAPVRGTDRLRRETEHRVRKRQTGNEPAYLHFLDWHNQWLFDPTQSNTEQTEDFVTLLLAFPPGEFFEDRVFEIWCLHQIIESFRRTGAVSVDGPHALTERSQRSICQMRYGNYRFEIWFQKALPSASAKWKYLATQRALQGIPDITVMGADGRRLLIDAKRREVVTQTRPEETYKMLGYLENFRNVFTTTPFWGVLCFLSQSALYNEIVADTGHKLFLVGAHDQNPAICPMAGRLDTVIAEWLALRNEDSPSVPPPATLRLM
jgi:hypothetical protein